MTEDVGDALRAQVRARAGVRCEYCLLHEEDALDQHQPDHIIARKHRGPSADGGKLGRRSDKNLRCPGSLALRAVCSAFRSVAVTALAGPRVGFFVAAAVSSGQLGHVLELGNV